MTFPPSTLNKLDIPKRNRWLKDRLAAAGFRRVMLGSLDISWEKRRGEAFFQPHWHIGMWTSNRKKLRKRLKKIFPGEDEYDRPVMVSKTFSLEFLAYKDKAIKLPELLRHNRTQLPELLLLLDRTEPLELMVLNCVRASAQDGGIKLDPIAKKKARAG